MCLRLKKSLEECGMSEAQSFQGIVKDMVDDLLISFPELEPSLDADLRAIRDDQDGAEASVERVKLHCTAVFPKKFFDILYENAAMFDVEDGSCLFLPKVDYAVLWKENISDNTRKTIWKYLQLLLFSSVANVSDKSSFGETAKLFSAINDEEFKTKLEETMASMKSLFSGSEADEGGEGGEGDEGGKGGEGGEAEERALPNVSEIHAHVSKMMEGKLGSLAKDIAQETLNDMGEGTAEDGSSIEDVFARLIRDPGKLMEMIKSVGTKLDEKIKNGEIKESELLEEASGILKNMHKLPGMDHMKDMFKQMGVPDMSSAQSGQATAALRRKAAAARMKEKLRAKLAKRQAAKLMEQALEKEKEKSVEPIKPMCDNPRNKKPAKKKKKKKKKST